MVVLCLAGVLNGVSQENPDDERWVKAAPPSRSKGQPVTSSWHTGTAGIIKNDGAEISLFNATRIGMTKSTELQFRIAEEWLMPNVGLKHNWMHGEKLFFSSEHSLYCPWPGLKMAQKSGYKDLIDDSVTIGFGVAMRHELILSWLMNPMVAGCPNPAPERILSFRLGTEFYLGGGDTPPFDYFHSLYHTQVLDKKMLYYGGAQFDSYFSHRFHYSVNALFYSVDFSSQFAAEGNARLTCYFWRRFGISLACKAAYIRVSEPLGVEKEFDGTWMMQYDNDGRFSVLPFIDLTLLVHPDRGEIRHGLFKNRRRRR